MYGYTPMYRFLLLQLMYFLVNYSKMTVSSLPQGKILAQKQVFLENCMKNPFCNISVIVRVIETLLYLPLENLKHSFF